MCWKRDGKLGFTKEIEKNWEHLLLADVVLLKPRHIEDFIKLLEVVVAEVSKQVVVVVADCGREEAGHLVPGDIDLALDHGVAYDRLPDVVVDLVQVLHQHAFVAPLVSFVVLKHRNEVSCHKLNREQRVTWIPLSLIFRYRDVTFEIILLCKHPLEDVDQVIEILDLLIVS